MDGGRRTADAARRTDIWITKSLSELSSGETKMRGLGNENLETLHLESRNVGQKKAQNAKIF